MRTMVDLWVLDGYAVGHILYSPTGPPRDECSCNSGSLLDAVLAADLDPSTGLLVLKDVD
jgi:hypothetical protein